MAETYSVLFTGRLKPGADPEQVAAAFAARFRVHPQRVRDMLEAGGEVVVKSGLDAGEAREHEHALARIGLEVRIDPPVAEDARIGEFHAPRTVPAGHGWNWLRDGFKMVFAKPADWIVAVLLCFVLNFILNLIPIAGFASPIVAPVFVGGLMLGAYNQDRGGKFGVGYVFAGFSGSKVVSLLLAGAVYAVALVLIDWIVELVMGMEGLAPATLAGLDASSWMEFAADQGALPSLLLPLLVGLTLTIPLSMAYWFTPVLVALDEVPPFKAMEMSFRASLRNILPFTVYGLIAPAMIIAGAIPLLLGLLVVMPAIVASFYTSYRDIFRD
ncbi:MAG: BPSS1780 family membrane protein [Arenicellales bacterium]